MKKFLALMLAVIMMFALVACGDKATNGNATDGNATNGNADATGVKMGLICLHDENSTYDSNFIQAAEKAAEELGFELVKKVNIGEDDSCAQAATELAEDGCDVIFADSFGHESYIMTVAEDYPEVQFCHATGTHAKTAGIANFHNAFASIYEGRYLAGIVAGMKINEMIENGDFKAEDAKMGYVGAFPYAEVISGFTSFYLGAKSVCPTVTMEVKYTNSWFDIALEKEAADALISDGCVLISQHADSEGAPKACEEAKVPNVAYNVNTINLGPTTALISSKIDWTPYFKMIVESVAAEKEIPADWCGSIATGSVVLTDLNKDIAAEGTQEAIDEAVAKLNAGELKVFDTTTFTVDGKSLDSYMADVVPDEAFEKDTEVVADGYFHESDVEGMRSAPYFDIIIDGIDAPVPAN